MADTGTAALHLPNVTVQQLAYSVEVTRHPSWAAAAEALGVTPSALSQGLAELERRVGLPLFERQGRRQQLRAAAAPVVGYAEQVVARTHDLARWAQAEVQGRVGTLHVGMIDAAAVHHFPAALAAFRADRPELDLHLQVAPSGDLLAALARGDLDLAVVVDPGLDADAGDLALTPLLEEPLAVVYAPPDGGVGRPASWGPWVTFPAGSRTRAVIAEALRHAGAPFEVVAESHQPEVLREMVHLGMGWTVLPVAQGEVAPPTAPLRRVRRRPLTTRRLVAAQRAGSVDHPAAAALVAFLVTAPHPAPTVTLVLVGVALVVGVAGGVASLTGFGFALVAVPVLALLLDPKDAVALTNILALGATGILLARLWHHVDRPVARRMVAAALPGLPVGLAVLVLASATTLTLVIAAAVLATVMLLWRNVRLPGTGWRLDVGAGLACGVLTTSTGTNGPPLVLALVARGQDPDTFRATISAVFAAVGVLGVAAILASGQVTAELLPALAVGVPAMLVGWWAGWRLHQRLDPARFRPLILTLLAASAVAAAAGAIARA